MTTETESEEKPKRRRRPILLYILLFLLLCVLAAVALLALGGMGPEPTPTTTLPGPTPGPTSQDPVAILSEVQGLVQVRRTADGMFEEAQDGMGLFPGAQVKVLSRGSARASFVDGVYLRLASSTTLTIQGAIGGSAGVFAQVELSLGDEWALQGGGGGISIDTLSGSASASGAYLNVHVDPVTDIVRVTCLQGICDVSTQAGSVQLQTGYAAILPASNVPPTPGCMTDEDVALWLQVNPEATAVIPEVTERSPACPFGRATPTPTGTFARITPTSARATPTPPVTSPGASPTPTATSTGMTPTFTPTGIGPTSTPTNTPGGTLP